MHACFARRATYAAVRLRGEQQLLAESDDLPPEVLRALENNLAASRAFLWDAVRFLVLCEQVVGSLEQGNNADALAVDIRQIRDCVITAKTAAGQMQAGETFSPDVHTCMESMEELQSLRKAPQDCQNEIRQAPMASRNKSSTIVVLLFYSVVGAILPFHLHVHLCKLDCAC
jgi:hypothetical protein